MDPSASIFHNYVGDDSECDTTAPDDMGVMVKGPGERCDTGSEFGVLSRQCLRHDFQRLDSASKWKQL